jgi:hypothetical protein
MFAKDPFPRLVTGHVRSLSEGRFRVSYVSHAAISSVLDLASSSFGVSGTSSRHPLGLAVLVPYVASELVGRYYFDRNLTCFDRARQIDILPLVWSKNGDLLCCLEVYTPRVFLKGYSPFTYLVFCRTLRVVLEWALHWLCQIIMVLMLMGQ